MAGTEETSRPSIAEAAPSAPGNGGERLLLDEFPLPYQSLDAEGRFLDVNEAWLTSLGYSRTEIIGTWFGALLHEDSAGTFARNFPEFLRRGQVHDVEFRMRRADGTWIHVSFDGRVGRDPDGTFRQTHCIFKDVTERYRAEALLRERERQLRLITDHMRDTVWLMDLAFKPTWISPSVVRTRGYTLEELRELPLERQLTPASLEAMMRRAVEVMTPEALADPSVELTVTLELEYFRKDGTSFWGDTVATVLRDDQGQPSEILGVGRDITDRKRAEDALRDSERRYRLLAESVNDVVWSLGLDGRFTYVSPSVERLRGFTAEEVMQQPMEAVLSPGSLEVFQAELARGLEALASGSDAEPRVVVELEQPCRDGSTVWTEASVGLLRDEQGAPIGIHGVSRDITERRWAREALSRRVEELERFNRTMVGRELRMIELKREVNALLEAAGQVARYRIPG